MTKTTETVADETSEVSSSITPLETAIAEAVATREPPKGVAAGMEFLRASFDEEAHILWTANGPKRTRTTELAGALVEINGVRRVIIISGLESGAFKLFAEVPKGGPGGQDPAIMENMYGGVGL